MSTKIPVNSTIRINVVFRDWDSQSDYGDPVNPDKVVVVIYDPDGELLDGYVEYSASDHDNPDYVEGTQDETTDVGEFYHLWTPTEPGAYVVKFVGIFIDPQTLEKTFTEIEEEFLVGVKSVHGITLGHDQELFFAAEVAPLYIDPEEMRVHFSEASLVEIVELGHRYSVEIGRYFAEDNIPFIALEYVRAATLCALSKIYDYGVGGDESSVALGDLRITSRTYPRLRINRANAVNWCELAAALRSEMLGAASGMRAVVKGANFTNPMPKRGIRSPYTGTGRRRVF